MTDLTLRSIKGDSINIVEGDDNFVNAASIGKNFLQNGNFDIWQGGTTANTALSGADILCDRWDYVDLATGTHTVTRREFTVGQTDVQGNPRYYYEINVDDIAALGPSGVLSQGIENVYTLSGREVTLSFYCKSTVTTPISISCTQDFGVGGAFSVATEFSTVNISTSWAKYTTTFTFPSIAGKTVGTGSHLLLRFNLTGTSNHIISFAQAQLELGNTATAFEYIPISQELQRCRRHCVKSYDDTVFPATASAFGGSIAVTVPPNGSTTDPKCTVEFPVRMADVPSLFIYSPKTGDSLKIYDYFFGVDSHNLTVESISETGFELSHDGASPLSGTIHYLAYTDYHL